MNTQDPLAKIQAKRQADRDEYDLLLTQVAKATTVAQLKAVLVQMLMRLKA